MTRKTLAALLLVTSLGTGTVPFTSAPASAQLAVFDPSNFAQNVLQAAHALEQINNQIVSLQNEAVMLQNMAKELARLDYSSLEQITDALERIDALMRQAQGIAFEVGATEAAFKEQFPEQYDEAMTMDGFLAEARKRWLTTMEAFRQTLLVQAQVAGNVQADMALLAELVAKSQSAVGSLQAQQAGNQLIALSTKQQLQIQSLMAAHYRAEALDRARKAQEEEAARAATARFLGSGKAYTPL